MSEAKGERIHLYTCRKTEEDKLLCPLCSYAAGRASRDGLRKALEMIAGDGHSVNRIVSVSMAVAMKALEADGGNK